MTDDTRDRQPGRAPDALRPLADAEWPEAVAALRPDFAGQLNVYRTMAHHPALLAAWAPLRRHLVRESALGPERSEVAILRAGARLGSDYEWAHHVVRARGLGMREARIARLGGALDAIPGEDGLIASAVDQQIATARLDAETRRRLMETLGTEATLDLLALVGFYFVLGSILLTFEVPLDDDIAEDLARAPAPVRALG